MKVVHISTNDTGGAATSAIRIHQGLLNENIDSYFLCLNKTHDNVKGIQRFNGPYKSRNLYEMIQHKIFGVENSQSKKNLKKIPKTKQFYEGFTFPITDFLVEKNKLIEYADIIHLHWVSDFINYPTFFKNIHKPIVWTLHDMNPLLGGFHYVNDKNINEKEFGLLEKNLADIKKKSLSDLKAATIVTPSKWLGESAKQQNIFKNADFCQIPYGLNTSIFKQCDKNFARTVFNLPLDKKIIMFVSDAVENYRKGFDMVLEAMQGLEDFNFQVVVIGAASQNIEQKSFINYIGKINDERLMSLLYSGADLFILPSREDNLPNVMLESFACGTPVLSFRTGGMAEYIQDGFNGFFAEDISAKSLKASLTKYLKGELSFCNKKIRDFAVNTFSLNTQTKKYIELYQSIK